MSAPEFEWALRVGGAGWTFIRGTATDHDGNVLVVGPFGDTVDFGITNFTARTTNFFGNDGFVAKYDRHGQFQWARQFGGDGDDYGQAVAVDSENNVYVVGYFDGTASFGNTNVTPGMGICAGFVSKYDPSGELIWVVPVQGSMYAYAISIGIDDKDNLFITGYFSVTIIINETGGVGSGSDSMFLASLDKDGNVRWLRTVGGNNNTSTGESLAVSANGETSVTGHFIRETSFGTASDFYNSRPSDATNLFGDGYFLAHYDASGTFRWVRQVNVPTTMRVAADSLGNTYLGGYFEDSVSFDDLVLTNTGRPQAFLAKYNQEGALQWVRQDCDTNSSSASAVAVDNLGNAILAGLFNQSAAFGTNSVVSVGGGDVFVVKYSPGGEVLWTTTAGGSRNEGAKTLSVDDAGNIIVAGIFQGTAYFGNTNLTMGIDFGRLVDPFVSRLTSTSLPMCARMAGTNVELSWPRLGEGYILEHTTNINYGWTQLSPVLVSIGKLTTTVLPRNSENSFFRLRKP